MTNPAESLSIGWHFHQRCDYLGAEAIYRRVVEANPQNADAWCYLGILHYDLARYAESVQCYEKAVELRPEFPIALSNRANSLGALERFKEAEASVRKALALKPDYPTAWNNLGALLFKQGKFREAAETFEKSIELMPENESAHRNLGALLIRQGRFEEGSLHSESALRLNPGSAEAHRNRALVRLLMGDFEQGWDEYEWRFHCGDHALAQHYQPLWTGEPLEGRTLLLHAEQGLGDTIHFLRYAELARQRGGRVIVECQAPLWPLLASYGHVDQLIRRGDPLPPCDLQLPLMSVPRVLGTRLDNIPSRIPYLFARQDLVTHWSQRLDELVPPAAARIGIVWQGSADHHANRDRSIPLAQFAPLAREGFQLISLQKGGGTEQIPQQQECFSILDLGDELDTSQGPFMDTAAILANVDLLLTIDTSVAHLAGALGVPTWLLLSNSPDWRWMLHRDDSPWYPTFRLFRQSQSGDWKNVLDRVQLALVSWERSRSKGNRGGTSSEGLNIEEACSNWLVTRSVRLSIGRLVDQLAEIESRVFFLEASPEAASSEATATDRELLSQQIDSLREAYAGLLGEQGSHATEPTSTCQVDRALLESARSRLRQIHDDIRIIRNQIEQSSLADLTDSHSNSQARTLAGLLRQRDEIIAELES